MSYIISIHGYSLDDIDSLYPDLAVNEWSFQELESADLVRAMNCLPNKESTGINKVPNLLKTTAAVIAPVIAFCINIAITMANFPNEMLKGRLKLIHKSDGSDINNFRGLTLLPVVSKIFEFIISEQLMSYLDSITFFLGINTASSKIPAVLELLSNWSTS